MVSAPELGQWGRVIAFPLMLNAIDRPMPVDDDQLHEALPDYSEFSAAFARCGAPQSPAEAQGFAVGMQLAEVKSPLARWHQELYSDFDSDDVLAQECRVLLDRLFATVFARAEPGSDAFALLLPQDVLVDSPRLVAVRDWCQGFLYGVGLGGEALTGCQSAQMQDLLRDIAEIARLDVDDVDNTRENQSALIEIEEYLRVGVLLLREELNVRDRTDDAE